MDKQIIDDMHNVAVKIAVIMDELKIYKIGDTTDYDNLTTIHNKVMGAKRMATYIHDSELDKRVKEKLSELE